MQDKPEIFIASPLFNMEQHAVLDQLESLLTDMGYVYYSARHHSGGGRLSPEEKRQYVPWKPVFQSNEEGLFRCKAMVAVLDYPLPRNQSLALVQQKFPPPTEHEYYEERLEDLRRRSYEVSKFLRLPDAGTVFEVGHFRAQRKPVVGFHVDSKPDHLNLMLSHGCHGTILGWGNLQNWLTGRPQGTVGFARNAAYGYDLVQNQGLPGELVDHFDWSACYLWDQEVE